jgi:Tfp pilus assembly protein PilO
VGDLKTRAQWYQRARLLLGVCMLTLVVGFYLFGYRPQKVRLEALRQSHADELQNLRVAEDQTRRLPDVAGDVRLLRARLERTKRLPPQDELPACIKEIDMLGQQSALRTFDITPGSPHRQELFNDMPVDLRFQGDYVDVVNFLRKLDEVQRLTRVRSIKMSSTHDRKSGQVEVQLSMELYFAASN